MEYAIVAFALGVLLCQQQAELLAWQPFMAGALLLGLAGCRLAARPRARLTTLLGAALLAGFAYADWRAGLRLADHLAPALIAQDLVLTGQIEDLPQAFERGLRFRFRVENPPAGVPSLLNLSWYAGRDPVRRLRAGSQW